MVSTIRARSWQSAVCLLVALSAHSCIAETFYEVAGGLGKYNISVTQKTGEGGFDESRTINFSLGAYRHSSDTAAWGAVMEVNHTQGRDDALPGNGRLLSFRPINYLRHLGANTSFEIYAGVAQYEWRKTANGFYTGASLRYEIFDNRVGLGLDAKYYQDLAFDSPEGDDIVDGWHPGLKIFYRFK